MTLTVDRLREVLKYDPETGHFTWKIATSFRVSVGSVAGVINGHGYWVIRVDKTLFFAHRLAWFYVHGEWPSSGIDHRNGDKLDNSIANLRIANQGQNCQNRVVSRLNKSGFVGVSLDKRRRKWKWVARIGINGKVFNLGRRDTPYDAYKLYLEAKANIHTFQPAPRS